MKHSTYQYDLMGGGRALVVDVPGASVLTSSVIFRSGYDFGNLAKYEIPHVTEHLMGSGNTKYPSALEFKTEVEKNGAYRNASTSPLFNTYDYECADFEAKRILQLQAAQVSAPMFPKQSFATEISNVNQELSRNLSNYDRASFIFLNKAMLPDRWLDEETRLAQLPSITISDVEKHYKRTHLSGNMWLLLAGHAPGGGRELIDCFESSLLDLPTGERLDFVEPEIIVPAGPVLVKKPIKQLHYTLQSLAPKTNYRQRLAGRLLSMLLTGGYGSWIHGESRERGLAYHVSSSFGIGPDHATFRIWYNVTPENAEELFKLFVKGYGRAATGAFGETELGAAKDLLVGAITRSTQTASDLLGWYNGDFIFDDKTIDFAKYLADLRTVTPQEVQMVASQLIKEGKWGLSFVGDISKTEANKLYKTLSDIWS